MSRVHIKLLLKSLRIHDINYLCFLIIYTEKYTAENYRKMEKQL